MLSIVGFGRPMDTTTDRSTPPSGPVRICPARAPAPPLLPVHPILPRLPPGAGCLRASMCCPAVSALPPLLLLLCSPVSCSRCPYHPQLFRWSQLAVTFVSGLIIHHTDRLPHCGHGTLRTCSPAIVPPNASPICRRLSGLVRIWSLSCLSWTAAFLLRGGGGAALRAARRSLRSLYSLRCLSHGS